MNPRNSFGQRTAEMLDAGVIPSWQAVPWARSRRSKSIRRIGSSMVVERLLMLVLTIVGRALGWAR
jgi:hypothetical protein